MCNRIYRLFAFKNAFLNFKILNSYINVFGVDVFDVNEMLCLHTSQRQNCNLCLDLDLAGRAGTPESSLLLCWEPYKPPDTSTIFMWNNFY